MTLTTSVSVEYVVKSFTRYFHLFPGQFGRVYRGELHDEKGINCGVIAVKTLKCKQRKHQTQRSLEFNTTSTLK